MLYTITHLKANGSTTERTPWPVKKTAAEAASVVRRATMQDARESIAQLDATLTPAVVIPYMDDPSQGVEVRVAP